MMGNLPLCKEMENRSPAPSSFDVIQEITEVAAFMAPEEFAAFFTMECQEPFEWLQSDDSATSALGLDALIVRGILRLFDGKPIRWLERAFCSGGTTSRVLVEMLFYGERRMWQVQCKNTPSEEVRLEAVAKEVGLIPLTRATHIMVLANAPFTRDARRYADAIMQNSSVTIFLLDREDFEAIRASSARLGGILLRQAERISDLKMATPIWRESDAHGGPEQPSLGFPLG